MQVENTKSLNSLFTHFRIVHSHLFTTSNINEAFSLHHCKGTTSHRKVVRQLKLIQLKIMVRLKSSLKSAGQHRNQVSTEITPLISTDATITNVK